MESAIRTIRQHAPHEPQKVGELCCSNLLLAAQRQSIIVKAIKHISELELRLMLAEQQVEALATANEALMEANEVIGSGRIPWLLNLVMRLYGFRMGRR